MEAAAKPFGAIDQLVVLNGAEGLSATLAQALSQGVAGLGMARKLLGAAAEPHPSTPPTAPVPAASANGRLTDPEPAR